MTPDFNFDSAQKQSQDELLRTWYDAELQRTTGIGLEEAQGSFSEFRDSFINWCTGHALQEKVCNDWKYCSRMKEYGSGIKFLSEMAVFIGLVTKVESVAATASAVLVVKHGLGFKCNCGE
jgi:hypothetical protein